MSNRNASPTGTAGPKLPPAIIAVAILSLFAAVTWWQNNHAPKIATGPESQTSRPSSDPESSSALPDQHAPTLPNLANEDGHDRSVAEDSHDDSKSGSSHESADRHGKPSHGQRQHETAQSSSHASDEKVDEKSYQVPNQTIRNLNGKVVFEGTVDLKPTLDRIEKGEANRHKNDGTTFQNREGRLPKKSSGYYKEYVHPTPGESGPGPQRIILGKEREIWYTPDHYKSFVQIPMQLRSE